MGKIPTGLREIIARNIRECRLKKFHGRGGGKKCAEAFGVSPQQWLPWEKGKRTPDELQLAQIAEFFGVTVERLRRDNRPPPVSKMQSAPLLSPVPGAPPALFREPSPPGSAVSFYWLAHRFVTSIETNGLRLDKESLEYLARIMKR